VDGIRAELCGVEHYVSLEGARDGWLDHEALLGEAPSAFERSAVGESDLLTINYTSGTTSRPKGVMITQRNAWMNTIGVLVHFHLTAADHYLWTLPMFHARHFPGACGTTRRRRGGSTRTAPSTSPPAAARRTPPAASCRQPASASPSRCGTT
jgi:hypothetical protein